MSNQVKLILKAAAIISSVTTNRPRQSLTEIYKRVGINRVTAYRILSTLVDAKLLEREPKTGAYMIGPALFRLGSLYHETRVFTKIAEPVVKKLNELTGEAVSLAVLDKDTAVWILFQPPNYPFRFERHGGTTLPAYASAMGKALLSELPEEEIDRIFPQEKLEPLTDKTLATKKELKEELELIRKTGISIDTEGSFEGLEGFASVIRDTGGLPIAALSISSPVFRLNPDRRTKLSALVKMACSSISYSIGYQDPANPVHTLEEIVQWWKRNSVGMTKSWRISNNSHLKDLIKTEKRGILK
jgi:DNA-binding IclR family transcriptional regulator